MSPVALPSPTAPLSPSITSTSLTPLTQTTEDLTDLSQVLSQQPSADTDENQETCAESPCSASLPDGYYRHAYSKKPGAEPSSSDGYYDHAYSKKYHQGLGEQYDELTKCSVIMLQKEKPPPKRRGRPPIYKKVQPFVCADSQPSSEEVTAPPHPVQLEQPSSPGSKVPKELSPRERRSILRRHYWTARYHLLRVTSRFHRPKRPVTAREKIASEAAKYVSKEFQDILRAELRLPALKSVKNKQASCSGSLSTAEGRGDCRQVRKLSSFGPESLDEPQIFLSSLDGTNASTQVSCWQVSMPMAQCTAKVSRRASCQNVT